MSEDDKKSCDLKVGCITFGPVNKENLARPIFDGNIITMRDDSGEIAAILYEEKRGTETPLQTLKRLVETAWKYEELSK